uniref:Uncharacterized protein n=1 Tax=Setaria italica TaxID=4555 RepID=K3Y3X2_SETIT
MNSNLGWREYMYVGYGIRIAPTPRPTKWSRCMGTEQSGVYFHKESAF